MQKEGLPLQKRVIHLHIIVFDFISVDVLEFVV